MIERIPYLPANVIGFEASGKVTEEDYTSVLIPAAEKIIEEHGEARILYVLGDDVTGFSAGAMWEDTKVGLHHRKAWEKFAIVTDIDWLRHSVKVFGWAVPGEVRVFAMADRAEAERWIAA